MAESMATTVTAASAPGKVLLAGGYLVLDRQYEGLVFGLSARIHTHIRSLPPPLHVNRQRHIVRSPQFIDAEWCFALKQKATETGVTLDQLSGSANPFVKTTLEYCLTYVRSFEPTDLESSVITILADDAYYSSGRFDASVAKTDRFKSFDVTLGDAHKTGLGSSAALVTSLTAALLAHYLGNFFSELGEDEQNCRVHNLAQAAHCAAQGKIGSGFDVAAAVYGSCTYRRFSPSVLDHLGASGSEGFEERLRSVVDDLGADKIWDVGVEKGAAVPSGLRLVMCDVDCGSQTVGMAKKVLAWRQKEVTQALDIWKKLDARNQGLMELMRANLPAEEQLRLLPSAFEFLRSSIREMSNASGVPIEPPAQTRLLDACNAIDGVVGGVVPGAGGYDAVVLLINDDESVIQSLQALFVEMEAHPVEEGSTKSVVRILDVQQEQDGIRVENPSAYQPWSVA